MDFFRIECFKLKYNIPSYSIVFSEFTYTLDSYETPIVTLNKNNNSYECTIIIEKDIITIRLMNSSITVEVKNDYTQIIYSKHNISDGVYSLYSFVLTTLEKKLKRDLFIYDYENNFILFHFLDSISEHNELFILYNKNDTEKIEKIIRNDLNQTEELFKLLNINFCIIDNIQ